MSKCSLSILDRHIRCFGDVVVPRRPMLGTTMGGARSCPPTVVVPFTTLRTLDLHGVVLVTTPIGVCDASDDTGYGNAVTSIRVRNELTSEWGRECTIFAEAHRDHPSRRRTIDGSVLR